MKKMCVNAGLQKYTNHSLQAYGTSTLFQANVPEKLIQQHTGHKSVEVLRQHKHTSSAQLLDVSNIMAGAVSNPPSFSVGLVADNTPVSSSVSPTAITSPTFILSGCKFTGCSIAFSGQAMLQSTSKDDQYICDETLEGIAYEEIFED